MFRSIIVLFAMVTCGTVNAQELPSSNILYSAHNLSETDTAFYEDVGEVIEDFKTVCLSVYKSAVDSPSGRMNQQGVNWPVNYEKLTDRYSKRIGDINVDVKIDFNATYPFLRKTTEWEVSKLVTRPRFESVPAVKCEFHLSLSPEQTRTDLFVVANRLVVSKDSPSIDSSADEYAIKQLNQDCEYGLIRERNTAYDREDNETILKFSFADQPVKPMSELPFCKAQDAKKAIQSNDFQIQASGYVIRATNGETLGRVNAEGHIINPMGEIIGRVNNNYPSSLNR